MSNINNLFEVFNKIINHDYSYYIKNIENDEIKNFSPIINYQWLSASSNKENFEKVNDINKFVFSLGKYKFLQYMLLSTLKKDVGKYTWIKLPINKKIKNNNLIENIKKHHQINDIESRILNNILQDEEKYVKEVCKQYKD